MTPEPPTLPHPSTPPVPPQSLGGFGEDIKRRLDERECGRWERNGWGDGQSGSAQMWAAVKQQGSGRRSAADISGAAPPSRSRPFVAIPQSQRRQGCSSSSSSSIGGAAARTRGMSGLRVQASRPGVKANYRLRTHRLWHAAQIR